MQCLFYLSFLQGIPQHRGFPTRCFAKETLLKQSSTSFEIELHILMDITEVIVVDQGPFCVVSGDALSDLGSISHHKFFLTLMLESCCVPIKMNLKELAISRIQTACLGGGKGVSCACYVFIYMELSLWIFSALDLNLLMIQVFC
jgi:hypothetical protein